MDCREKKDLQGKCVKTREDYNADKWFDHEAREKRMDFSKYHRMKMYQRKILNNVLQHTVISVNSA